MECEYELSLHAEKRMQQRGIPRIAIEWLSRFGDTTKSSACYVVHFGKGGKKRLKHHLGRLFPKVESMVQDIYLIVKDETVVTIGHRYKRIKEA